jgi:hypothetical protein
MPPPLPASTYPSPSPFPSSTHHSRAAAASYHPYGDRSGRGGDNKPEDTWANLAALAGYGQSSYADLRAAADAGYNAYAAYNTRNSGLPDGQYGHGHGLWWHHQIVFYFPSGVCHLLLRISSGLIGKKKKKKKKENEKLKEKKKKTKTKFKKKKNLNSGVGSMNDSKLAYKKTKEKLKK